MEVTTKTKKTLNTVMTPDLVRKRYYENQPTPIIKPCNACGGKPVK